MNTAKTEDKEDKDCRDVLIDPLFSGVNSVYRYSGAKLNDVVKWFKSNRNREERTRCVCFDSNFVLLV